MADKKAELKVDVMCVVRVGDFLVTLMPGDVIPAEATKESVDHLRSLGMVER